MHGEFPRFLLWPRAESRGTKVSPASDHMSKKGRRKSKKIEELDGEVM